MPACLLPSDYEIDEPAFGKLLPDVANTDGPAKPPLSLFAPLGTEAHW